MSRREASKTETRRLILRAARRLFARKGMEESTIRDIARNAGVSPASVVVHFKSKTALLEQALSRDIETALPDLLAEMPEDGDVLGRLMHLAKGFFKLYDRNRSLYRALIRHTIFEPATETPHMTTLSERYVQALTGVIEEGKCRGVIGPDVDARVAAAAIFSLYLGALILLFRTPEMPVDSVGDVLAAMTDQYLRGIRS